MSSNKDRDVESRKFEEFKREYAGIWTEHKASEFGTKCAMFLHTECNADKCVCICHKGGMD